MIIIHEIPGLHPRVVRFADHVAAQGMTVFLPSLFGKPGKAAHHSLRSRRKKCSPASVSGGSSTSWAGTGSSPIVDWLRAPLARQVHGECGGA